MDTKTEIKYTPTRVKNYDTMKRIYPQGVSSWMLENDLSEELMKWQAIAKGTDYEIAHKAYEVFDRERFGDESYPYGPYTEITLVLKHEIEALHQYQELYYTDRETKEELQDTSRHLSRYNYYSFRVHIQLAKIRILTILMQDMYSE